MTITLTFTGSDEEIISGIPKTMTITASEVSVIRFTLDGTTPNLSSAIYIDTFDMPTGETSITLKAYAISYDGETASDVKTQLYAPNTTELDRTRHIGAEGVKVDEFGVGQDIEDGWDAGGGLVRQLDVEEVYLDFIKSPGSFFNIRDGTVIEVLTPDPIETSYPYDDNFVQTSTPEFASSFNPNARVIVIDNRKENEVNIIPRALSGLHNIYTEFGGYRLLNPADDNCYVSGGFVKRFYNANTNTMTSYHFDHNECRWLKNTQHLPEGIPTRYGFNQSGIPLVIPWIYRGRHSSIV